MLSIHLAFTLLCWACQPWTISASASARPTAISNPSCPAYPPPSPGTCGPFSHNRCDSNTASCAFQETTCDSAAPAAFSFIEPPIPKEVYISPEAYLYFKMLETEYVVEFAQNPMPFEDAIPLPFCGRTTTAPNTRRDEEDASVPKELGKRWNLKGQLFGSKPPGGTLGTILDKANPIVSPIVDKLRQDFKSTTQILNEVVNGIAHIDIPWLGKAPKYHPRPVCVPRNITVPIHFTIFATNYTTSSQVTVDVLNSQVDMANAAYLGTGIQFFISTLSYHVGEEFRPFAHHDLTRIDDPNNKNNKEYISYVERTKQENRYGAFDEINVWIVESLTAPSCDERGVYSEGYCTLARQLTYADRSVDGCVINIASLPNVTFNDLGSSDGTTLVHEIGHWFNLDHIFPEIPGKGGGCDGESDGIADTFQFPNDPHFIYEEYQPRCCHSGSGKSLKFFQCPFENLTHVTNYMSYARSMGQLDKNDPLGTRPWTMGQRAHMFASFFTMRRKAPLGGLDGDCLYYPVFKDTGSPASRRWNTDEFLQTRSAHSKRGLVSGGNVLRQSPALLETLKKVCAADPANPELSAINVITGDEVTCDGTTCQQPPGGAICPDGISTPPCILLPDPLPDRKQQCPDGSRPPCSADVCPLGTSLSCTPEEGFLCPDTGLKGPCKGTSSPPNGNQNKTACPKPCDVHFNKCDARTAPTCIFPDPRVAHPRAACACAPGFKATGAADGDVTKHWRLPILGQEHRVWVPEGVVCDAQCQGSGFDACKEVVILDKSCI